MKRQKLEERYLIKTQRQRLWKETVLETRNIIGKQFRRFSTTFDELKTARGSATSTTSVEKNVKHIPLSARVVFWFVLTTFSLA